MDTNTEKTNQIIGNVLRIGVILSVVTVIMGLFLNFSENNFKQIAFQENDAINQNYFQHFYSLLIQGESLGIVALGVLLMLATPILRLILSLLLFLKEKDFLYVGITLLVIGILIWSILLGS
ncbi:DUF1634 domain-containing protein [Capnocytophaga canimorsus]|uniref:DUF1634 domain-containing protein n=1 Tax=Capnocytophaga canimorsus TaxID=28188 RepID=UPI000BB1A982|nr:DUF1634 domain-containing protein [Capnocytophaga canimorsus]ATA77800.1 hypothetical protein CGC47_09545 [Capnocytophaga canimorsus]PJI79692.1 putative membrane protein [Capnocytophaga canimorsus]STA73091.1 Predicted membrane protein [Capnocytophaga canimorsus]